MLQLDFSLKSQIENATQILTVCICKPLKIAWSSSVFQALFMHPEGGVRGN